MTTISYQELSSCISDVKLLDVRNDNELQQHGKIPGSKRIPFPELNEALEMDKDEFSSKYGFEKPPPETPIVTYCMHGGRAMKAHDLLTAQGYTDVRCYSGSFSDWVKNGGEVVNETESQ